MADQKRTGFRFRLPWSSAAPASRSTTPRPLPQSPAPAPQRRAETQVPSQPTSTTTPNPTQHSVETETPTKPTTTTTTSTVTPQIDEAQAPTQSTTTANPSSTTPEKAGTQEPTQYTATTTSTPADTQTAQTQSPSQPTPTAIATTVSTERPPFMPPGVASPQAPLPQPQASRTESQPQSPSRVTSHSRVSSQPASPSRATTQSRSSQPASPSRATTQSQSSQPSTPARASSKSRATSLLSSPSRTGTPNSPTPRTTSQPRSPSRMASLPAGQASSTSPSSTAAKGQSTTADLTQSTSPSKREPRLSRVSSQPSSSSTENPSSLSEKEKKSTVSELQSIEQLQPKEETESGIVYDSQKQTRTETSIEPNEMVLHPSMESGMRTTTMFTPSRGPQTPVPTQKSDTPTIKSEPVSFPEDSKPGETKEVKEVMQKTEKKYEEDRDKDDNLLIGVPGSAVQTKDPSFAFQSEQIQQTVDKKEMISTPASNRKETKTAAQPRNKTMTVESCQKLPMTNEEHIPLHKEIRDDISNLVQKMAVGDPKHSINERLASVITLAGENKGATMHLETESMKKGGAVPIRRGYKINPDEGAETTTDGEGNFKEKSEETKDIEDQAAKAFVNSNVQGINNSIMLNSSITERNPGVHLVHSHFRTNLKAATAEKELLETEKTEFSTTHAQKLTYEPMVRRCLRGHFLESSDSDTDNTAKPRRHGCQVGCKEKSKENKIDVL